MKHNQNSAVKKKLQNMHRFMEIGLAKKSRRKFKNSQDKIQIQIEYIKTYGNK